MFSAYGFTFIAESLVAASQLALYKMAGHWWGGTGFSELALTRRTIALLNPLLVFGLAVALPRQLGLCRAGSAHGRAAGYLSAALLIVSFSIGISFAALNAFPAFWASLFFGNRALANLMLPLSILLCGLALHTVCYSYYRGTNIYAANTIQIFVLGVLPLAAAVLSARNLAAYYSCLGIATFVCAILAISPALLSLRVTRAEVEAHLKRILKFASPRMPGELMLVFCFSLPPTVVAHESNITEAGYVAFGISLLIMIGAAIAPISLVLLPKASEMAGSRDLNRLRKHVLILTAACAAITVGATAFLESSLDFLAAAFAGSISQQAAAFSKVLVLAAVPYGLYICLRSVLDACHERALNTIHIGMAAALLLACLAASHALGAKGAWPVIVAFVLCLFLLGFLTVMGAFQAVSILPVKAEAAPRADRLPATL